MKLMGTELLMAEHNEINRLSELAKAQAPLVIIGVGGKTLDTAKAVAYKCQLPTLFPTIASTDAPTSALSVIYTESGAFDSYLFYQQILTLSMDTNIIACTSSFISGRNGRCFSNLLKLRACSHAQKTPWQEVNRHLPP